jgi:predicted LPLAT superfamily acyltransferase
LLTKRIPADVHLFMYEVEGAPQQVASTPGIVVHYVQRGAADTAVEIVNALRSGGVVCLHGDRFFGAQRTINREFLGESARFPVGPMAIAAATGAAVISYFTVRTSRFHYTFSAATPIYVPSGRERRDENISAAVGKYVTVLERTSREYPHQWYNFFPFWAKADPTT